MFKQHLRCLSLQVLDGYVYLGNTATLNEETMNAFANVVGTAAHKVIRGVILTRQGLESKARNTSMVQDLVKLLPPDLFRTCLARVSTSDSNHERTAYHAKALQDQESRLLNAVLHLSFMWGPLHKTQNKQNKDICLLFRIDILGFQPGTPSQRLCKCS